MPDGLKNLGAFSFRHFWKGEHLRVTGASEKCILTKKHATNLQNRDALCSPTCTFAMGPGSGCHGLWIILGLIFLKKSVSVCHKNQISFFPSLVVKEMSLTSNERNDPSSSKLVKWLERSRLQKAKSRGLKAKGPPVRSQGPALRLFVGQYFCLS